MCCAVPQLHALCLPVQVESHVSDARECGGEVVAGGQRATDVGEGYFYQPTLLTGVTQDMVLNREETFGPVVPVARLVVQWCEIAVALTTVCGDGTAGSCCLHTI